MLAAQNSIDTKILQAPQLILPLSQFFSITLISTKRMIPTSSCASDATMGTPSQQDQSHCDSEGFTLVVRKGLRKESASGGDFNQHGKETGDKHLTKNASQSKSSKTKEAGASKAQPSLNISDENIFPSLLKYTNSEENSNKLSPSNHKMIVKEQISSNASGEKVLRKAELTEDLPKRRSHLLVGLCRHHIAWRLNKYPKPCFSTPSRKL